MIFHYRFRDEKNIVRKGKMTADSQESAVRRLEVMSITPFGVWADGEQEPPWEPISSPEEFKFQVDEPMPQVQTSKLPDSIAKQKEKEKERLEVLEKNSFKPIVSDGSEPQIPRIGQAMQPRPSRVETEVLPTKEQVYAANPRRVQTFLLGEYDQLRTRIDQMLASEGGKVLHLCMQPDIKGKLQIAVVIEHERTIP